MTDDTKHTAGASLPQEWWLSFWMYSNHREVNSARPTLTDPTRTDVHVVEHSALECALAERDEARAAWGKAIDMTVEVARLRERIAELEAQVRSLEDENANRIVAFQRECEHGLKLTAENARLRAALELIAGACGRCEDFARDALAKLK